MAQAEVVYEMMKSFMEQARDALRERLDHTTEGSSADGAPAFTPGGPGSGGSSSEGGTSGGSVALIHGS